MGHARAEEAAVDLDSPWYYEPDDTLASGKPTCPWGKRFRLVSYAAREERRAQNNSARPRYLGIVFGATTAAHIVRLHNEELASRRQEEEQRRTSRFGDWMEEMNKEEA
jgi:hypothetical protein